MSIRRLSKSLVSSQTSSTPGAYLYGFGSAYASSITIPTHQVGDVIVIYARGGAYNSAPVVATAGGTVPTWTQIVQAGTSGYGMSSAYYCVATANNHTSGTWTNATGMIVAVVRRASGIGGNAGLQAASTAPWTAPAVTLNKSNGTSVLLHFYGWGDAVNTSPASFSAAPQGYTQQFANRTTLVALALQTKNFTDCGPIANLTTPATIIWSSQITVEVLGS